jgi:hypothetical protein
MGKGEAELSVADALEDWRRADRLAIRATAQREAAAEAIDAAVRAQEAARSTADAAEAALVAATQAARAATATADAADKVLASARTDSEARQSAEQAALRAAEDAQAAHRSAAARVDAKYGRGIERYEPE